MAEQIKPEIKYCGLRQWLVEADKLGELKSVEGAIWEKEIGRSPRCCTTPTL